MRFPVSIDVLFLLVLVPAHTQLHGQDHLVVLPFIVYLLLELWHPLGQYSKLPETRSRGRLLFLARFMLLLIIIAGAAILPSYNRIKARAEIAKESADKIVADPEMHDGALQTELALQFLSQGMDPYVESYHHTPLEFYGFYKDGELINPALDSFVYLPGLLAVSYPPYLVASALDIFYDQRLIWLLAYILLVLIVPQLFIRPIYKLLALILIGLNPLITGPVIRGMNDITVILALTLAVWALMRSRLWLSIIFMGLACVLKQSAWFILPFYLALFVGRYTDTDRRRRILVAGGILLVVALLFASPFMLWDGKAFLSDVLAYPGGASEINYPIRGYNLGIFLVGIGAIETIFSPFPFWILQLFVGIPILILLLRRQLRLNTIGSMLVHAGVFILLMGFLSRFFQDNYVGMVMAILSLGILIDWEDRSAEIDPILAVPPVDSD